MRKNTKFGINALIITLVTVAAVILVNAIITTIAGKTALKIDLTRDKVYELSQQTKDVMKALDTEITAYALYPENTDGNVYTTYAEEYLSKYESLSENFKVQYIDPYSNPAFAKKYETQGQTIEAGEIILECGDKFNVVRWEQLYSASSYTNAISIDMEKALTSAVLKVTGKAETVKIYLVEGHDEHPAMQLASAAMENGYELDVLNISATGIPEDASILIIASPSADFTAEEIDALDAYLDNGGKSMFLFDSGTPLPERLTSYLAEWGIVPTNDKITEENNSNLRQYYGLNFTVPTLASHQITDTLLEQNLDFVMPYMGSLILDENNVRRAQLTPIISTSSSSWSTTDFMSKEKKEGDKTGPFVVAALAEMPDKNRSNIMVIGSLASVEMQGLLEESSFANKDFMLNAIGYMTEADSSMDIRSKEITAPKLNMNMDQAVTIVVILQYILPILILVLGLIVWLKRRYK